MNTLFCDILILWEKLFIAATEKIYKQNFLKNLKFPISKLLVT